MHLLIRALSLLYCWLMGRRPDMWPAQDQEVGHSASLIFQSGHSIILHKQDMCLCLCLLESLTGYSIWFYYESFALEAWNT